MEEKLKRWRCSIWSEVCSVFRFLRQTWWRWSEQWPLSSIIIFIKALLLLVLWLTVAFLVFDVVISPRIQVPEEKTVSLLGVLITALIGFGVQQWKSQTEEEAKRKQELKDVLQEIRGLSSVFRDDLSDGARRYLDFSTRGGRVWESGRVQSALKEERKAIEPPELQDALRLFKHTSNDKRFFEVAETIGYQRSVEALEWTYKELDDDLRSQALMRLVLLNRQPGYRRYIANDTLRILEETRQCAALRAWPHLSLWRDLPLPITGCAAKGLEYLGRENSPFGSGQAETDTLLLKRQIAVSPPWLAFLQEPRPVLFIGSSGSGKTASALLTVYDNFKKGKNGFPVYFPITYSIPELNEVAKVTAKTLLHYLAAVPAAFLKCSTDKRSAIAHLLVRYMHPKLTLRFHQAGLPRGGEGSKVLKEIEGLTQKSSFQDPLADYDLLALLSQARPRSFRYSIVLLDVQEKVDETGVATLFKMSDALARGGVFVKSFLPDTSLVREQIDQLSIEPIELHWSDDLLLELLGNYLQNFGDDSLAAWCDPELRARGLAPENFLSPDERLVRAAEGTPGGLIRKGNELLCCIGQNQHALTASDLDDILGPLPDEGDK